MHPQRALQSHSTDDTGPNASCGSSKTWSSQRESRWGQIVDLSMSDSRAHFFLEVSQCIVRNLLCLIYRILKTQIQYNQVTNCTRLEAQVQELYMGKFVSNPIGGVLKIRILEGATCQSCRTFETAVVWTPSTVQLQSITMESPITTQLGNSKAESCIRVAANSFHRNSTLKQFVEGRNNVAIDRPHCANKVHHQALANREHQESWTANTPWCPQWQVERDAQQFFLESCLIRVSCTVAVYPKWYVGVSTRMVGAPCVTAASMVPKLAQRCFRNLDTKLVGKKKCQQWTNVEHCNRLFTLPQPVFGEVHQGLHIVNRLAFPGNVYRSNCEVLDLETAEKCLLGTIYEKMGPLEHDALQPVGILKFVMFFLKLTIHSWNTSYNINPRHHRKLGKAPKISWGMVSLSNPC